MTAVIYARYSSDNQREESIEGQIRECTAYAEKNGVHLISVMEPIAEGSQGILVETLLEGMAEYYSAELSEKVIRGQTKNALKGKCTGSTETIGYKIDEDKVYHLDPLTTKLFCGKCGALMFGESGTSATGRTYYYYKCANVKRCKGCNKKTV